MNPPSGEVLVIGAAGKTGRAVTRALTLRGVPVRAVVRSTARAAVAEDAGASSAVVADLDTGDGLDDAVRGVDAVYHLAPNVHPDEVGMAERVARAASRAGVRRFVFHSVLHPDDTSMPHHARKAAAEEVVRGVVPSATVLRPAAYHQNLVDAARRGLLEVPYSLDVPFTNVDLDDVAEVAALVLTTSGHEGAVHDLCGPEALTVRQMAARAGTVLGHSVRCAATTVEAWLAGPGAALPPGPRSDLEAMFRSYDANGLVGPAATLTALLGRTPSTWEEALRR